MKKILFILFILFTFTSCEKEDDDTEAVCTPGYTTISGHILTSDNTPLKGVELQLKYVETQWLASYHSWLKRKTTTDANGSYKMSFNIKDNEVESFEGQSSSYFELQIDFRNLDPDKYFLPEQISETGTSYSYNPIISLKRDTVYDVSFYIPTKDYITVTLKNFKPTNQSDHFEVQTFFPWGTKSDEKKMLNTEYGISSSGYDHFVAKDENQTFRNVPVARNDTNIVRIIKMKNGVAYPEDYKIFVPEKNTIELTYEY
nr:carboxypeptidase-like regulatory domain-containing protein [uncultured Bacteroides sp.]